MPLDHGTAARRQDPPRDAADRLAALLDRAEGVRLESLPFDDLRELARLYRQLSARLARARQRDDDPDAIRHLNALCVRSYGLLYAPAPAEAASARQWLDEVRDAIGRTWHAQAAAWLLFLAGGIVGVGLAWRQPAALHALIPESLGYSRDQIDRLVSSPQARAHFLAGEETAAAEKFLFGSFLFVHNTRLGLLSFATGMLAGIPSALLQLYNGVVLGAFASIFFRDRWPMDFLAWILPHGIPEIAAVTLCTAAGLRLGAAVAMPGRPGRRRALREARNPALALALSAVPLFVVAAAIESFVRQSRLGTAPRLLIAGLELAALLAGLSMTRRLARRGAAEASWLRDLISPPRGASPDSGSGPRR